MALGSDDWDLSMEDLDSLERSALMQLAERRGIAAAAASPLKKPPQPSMMAQWQLKFVHEGDGKFAVETAYNKDLIPAFKTVPGYQWDSNRRLWIFPEHHIQDVVRAVSSIPQLKVDIRSESPLLLPSTVRAVTGPGASSNILLQCSSSQEQSPVKNQQKHPTNSPLKPDNSPMKPMTVQIYLMEHDRIAARSRYDERIKQACQSIPGRAWNAEEKVWTFPKTSLDELAHALQSVRAQVEVVHPLVLATVPTVTKSVMSSPLSSKAGDTNGVGKSEPTIITEKFIVKLFLHYCGQIAVKCKHSPKIVSVLRSIPRAVWHPLERLWMFPSSSLVEADNVLAGLDKKQFSLEHLEPLIRRALQFLGTVNDLSGKYLNIPIQLESSLLPFQRDGVRFGLQRGGRVLIADEMGLGKTLQAIAIAACFQEDWPVLVVVPSSLRLHWATMLKLWLGVRPPDITVVLSQGGGSNREGFKVVHSADKSELRLDGLFNIISYDIVTKLQDRIAENQFKVVIVDESHYLKNPQAKRTIACLPLIQKARYAVLLTGTPALSRPIELFKQLEALQPCVYTDIHEYGKRYCSGGAFGIYQGASNHEELHALMKTTVMIRRLKKEVLSELPQKRRQQVFLSLDGKGLKKMRGLFLDLKQIREYLKCSEDTDKWKAEERKMITEIYSTSAVVKLPPVEEYLTTLIEADCKFLVFGHHQTMLDGIENFLKKKKIQYIRIDGSTQPMVRQALVTRFQETANVKIALLSIRAAGVGLTLTAASTVVFVEMSWTPGDLVQAEDRAHRIGQASSVNVYYLHAAETIDDIIWESVQHKLENLGQVLDGKEDTMRVAAQLSQNQSTLNEYLRPCVSRNLCEQYDIPTCSAASETVEAVSHQQQLQQQQINHWQQPQMTNQQSNLINQQVNHSQQQQSNISQQQQQQMNHPQQQLNQQSEEMNHQWQHLDQLQQQQMNQLSNNVQQQLLTHSQQQQQMNHPQSQILQQQEMNEYLSQNQQLKQPEMNMLNYAKRSKLSQYN